MRRVSLTDAVTGESTGRWIDLDRADRWDDATALDGSNRISVATGSQWAHETLWRSAMGNWVLQRCVHSDGGLMRYHQIAEKNAYDWLIANDHTDAVPASALAEREI